MIDLALRRRFFAEEIAAVANVRSAGLVEALAAVPRERFLPPGPWTIVSEGAMGAARQTPDADARHVYHSVAVGIDPARQLFNGGPATLSMAIDALGLRTGERVFHLGCGLGYYTALLAHCVGRSGRVVAVEVDSALAEDAGRNLQPYPWVEVRQGDGRGPLGEPFDALLVNAGVTHPLDDWLEALAPGGRMILPLTATFPPLGPIGKGLLLLLARSAGEDWAARLVTFVAIYSALEVRDASRNDLVRAALVRNPMPSLKRLRRDAHEAGRECWLHTPAFCLSV